VQALVSPTKQRRRDVIGQLARIARNNRQRKLVHEQAEEAGEAEAVAATQRLSHISLLWDLVVRPLLRRSHTSWPP
jgi:hypothetical protein